MHHAAAQQAELARLDGELAALQQTIDDETS